MLELERILENKPIRPPMISTLALRWQSACPQGPPSLSGVGGVCGATGVHQGIMDTPKDEEFSSAIGGTDADSKDASKASFCNIQWQKESLDTNNKLKKQKKQQQQFVDVSQQSQQQPKKNSISSINNNENINDNFRLDSSLIPIDSFNNDTSNNNNIINNNLVRTYNNNGNFSNSCETTAESSEYRKLKNEVNLDDPKKPIKRNTSLLNFKSLDFHLKNLYSNLRSKHSSSSPRCAQPQTNQNNSNSNNYNNNSPLICINNGVSPVSPTNVTAEPRRAPFLRIENTDGESENLLLTYPTSPYQTRRSSYDNRSTVTVASTNRSTSQLLTCTQYFELSRSRSRDSSPSCFLSPDVIADSARRSSTSDILSEGEKRSAASSTTSSRRPSTSDLLRKARERKSTDSANRLGRSASQGGISRKAFRGAGRRKSMY